MVFYYCNNSKFLDTTVNLHRTEHTGVVGQFWDTKTRKSVYLITEIFMHVVCYHDARRSSIYCWTDLDTTYILCSCSITTHSFLIDDSLRSLIIWHQTFVTTSKSWKWHVLRESYNTMITKFLSYTVCT